jgi:molybdopterin converting factor small subunit
MHALFVCVPTVPDVSAPPLSVAVADVRCGVGRDAETRPMPGDTATVAELRAWMSGEVDKLREALAEERSRRIALEARVAALERR